ncbi:cellulase family glycosylhydrolase [Nocardioides sp.]|uniref:cellulase family glycosylhydrolase n=1 Tax=Nocardioides sp. TaxID=35761 RepID=UPI003562A6D5
MRRAHLVVPLTALLLCLGLLSAPEPVEAAPTAAPGREVAERSAARKAPPQLRRAGRWLVDPQGRVVIVHGLNLVWKHDPYVPPATREGFRARDARWFARHGFNAARVGTLWAGLTPDAPGVADPSYLRRWQRVLDLLAKRRIWTLLDAHQDQWHETYGGEGVPDWAVQRPMPYAAAPPVVAPFPTGYWTPEVSTVFDNFWAGEGGLLDGWAAAWRIAAERWRDQPYLMGYDLLNEPWMGREWLRCLADGCEPSYAEELQPAMDLARREIREVDAANLVWWEPQQFAGGQPLDTFYEAVPGEKQLGFSWHSYCPEVFFESQGVPGGDVEKCWEFDRGRHEHALDQAREMRAVPMMSEWGATDNARAIHIDAAVADEHLMGWTHWSYKRWRDPTTADDAQGLFRDDTDLSSVKQEKLRELVRTYAQATAGTPLRMRFDTTTGDFTFRYRPDRSITAPTRIFVSPLHYPRGYRVRVRGGRVLDRDRRHLRVRATSPGTVVVRVTGRPS